ncbi:MAG: hypothetical protein ACJAW4_003491 [Paracoccaceae bacterium]|jgi:hypothetical protein
MVFRFIYATTVGGIAGVKQAQSGVFPICNECKRQLLRPAQIVIDGGAGFWVAVLGSKICLSILVNKSNCIKQIGIFID